ncbi:MAG: multi-sensor signal transduction histidine kinase [Gemmatimonadetes bacterium]|nr:multi-sensor signal transduction histidine kinase [Gemmatimonadota bacterium]
MTAAMTTEMRKTGVDVVGDMPWGTHFCVFYETKADLLETLVSYCRAGLESDEFCLWVVAAPLTVDDARQALRRGVPDFDQYLIDPSIEIVGARDWYLQDGKFDLRRVVAGWHEKLAHASTRGYAGVRVTGDTAWLEKNDWRDFCDYEESLNQSIANQRLAVMCTYPLEACGASEILDVVQTHQFALTKRRGSWEVIETAGHKQAKAEIKRLNEDLERRVVERTSQLTAANRQLTKEIRERQRAEEALRRSEAYLTDAQRLTHTGSWACNIATREVLHSSEEHSRLYGFDPDSGLPSFEEFHQRIHPDDQQRFIESLETANRTRTDFEVDFRVVLADGTTKFMHALGHPVRNASGDAGEFAGISMDVTEQLRADRERETLRQAQADLAHVTRVTTMGELTASLAHEIKQPIAAAVIGAQTCLRWLGREEPDVPEAREAASRILNDVTRASNIINRIRQLFQRGAPERELLDVNDIVQEMIGLLRSETSRYSISIRSEFANDLPKVMADRVQLQQVLMNLMLNGIEAMKDVGAVGELTIASRRDDDHQLEISVGDTGVGLQAEQAEQVFHAFFTTKPQGTGMGLPISRSIIESHGGRLWVSPNAGRGATFRFTLPIDLPGPADPSFERALEQR